MQKTSLFILFLIIGLNANSQTEIAQINETPT